MKRLPVSAVVVSRNEGFLLKDCLTSLRFCDEIIVYDLESTDDTRTIAQSFGALVIPHKVVPIVEEIRKESVSVCKYNWILFLDPDEVLTVPLQEFIISNFHGTMAAGYTAVELPWIFYYKNHRLKGGIWGGIKFKRCLLDKTRHNFSSEIHVDITSIGEQKLMSVPDPDKAFIQHKWMRSSEELFEKHKRYIPKEAKQLAAHGSGYSIARHLKVLVLSFRDYLLSQNGYRDGLIGIYLTYFWVWYKHQIWKQYSQLTK